MTKHVYISADYDPGNGDRAVAAQLQKWGSDNLHGTDFIDMAEVVSGSVTKTDPDCRACNLKAEFNRQINASSAVVIIVGDKTADRSAGSDCPRARMSWSSSSCTPYKGNFGGRKSCRKVSQPNSGPDVCEVNEYSYLRHEFEQAKARNKKLIVVYNALNKQVGWLPPYLRGYEQQAIPFWKRDWNGNIVGNYEAIKKALA